MTGDLVQQRGGGGDAEPAWPPTFRPVARAVLRLLQAEGDRTPELRDLVLSDPALCLRMIAEANRALAGAGIPVASVDVALEILGREVCCEIVEAALSGPAVEASPAAMRVLAHAQVTGLAAATLARMLETCDPGEARVAGLLHDVCLMQPGRPGLADHGARARELLEVLGLPLVLGRAVGAHHEAAGDPALREQDSVLASIVRLADLAAASLGLGLEGEDPRRDQPEDERTRELLAMANDRVVRELGDGLLVLGMLLGVPRLAPGNVCAELRRLAAQERTRPGFTAGLVELTKRGMRALQRAATEGEALWILREALRAAPGVSHVFLVLDEAGEAMLGDAEGRSPFFVRAGDLAVVTPGFDHFMDQLQRGRECCILDRASGFDGVFRTFEAAEILAIPLAAGRLGMGALIAPSGRPLPLDLQAAFDPLAAACGDVIETLQLARTSYLLSEKITKDPLTDVLQRGHLQDILDAEIRVANRYRRPLAIVMFDVDHFKEWNDSYGHQVGDNILRDVARLIRDCGRDGERVGRYGGDEFMVVLPGAGREAAHAYAERVRARVESLGRIMSEACYDRTLSVSVGVAAANEHPIEAASLMFRADHALYRAKERGRNRVHAEHV